MLSNPFQIVVLFVGFSMALGSGAIEVEAEPSACVSILVYKDEECNGEPLRALTFPTWSTKPGSPCYHDATMPNYSVKNQRCDLYRGTWHQSVFLFSDTCETTWYTQWYSPQEQVFTTSSCSQGFKLDYCVQGACPSDTQTEENHIVVPMMSQLG